MLINGLFDVERDPEERHNLFASTEEPYPELVENLTARLAYWRTHQIPKANKDAPDPSGGACAMK